MKSYKILSFILLIGFASFSPLAQVADDSTQTKPCFQDKAEKLQLIKEAESNQFRVRRIETSGNTYTRHRVFLEKMLFNEGYIFTQRNLTRSIKAISKIKTIYPISLKDVEIRLDRQFKDIDIIFCVIQKKEKLDYE